MNTRGPAEPAYRSDWHKSRYSQGADACVEIAHTPNGIDIRDSKLGAGSPLLTLTADAWQAFRISEQHQ